MIGLTIISSMVLILCFNFLVSFVWSQKQPIGERVDPQLAAFWFPLFKKNCKQHRYETIDDKVDKNMTKMFGANWKDGLMD